VGFLSGTEATVQVKDAVICIRIHCQEKGSVGHLIDGTEAFKGYSLDFVRQILQG
jgi:hypothetical protein